LTDTLTPVKRINTD